jgi:hypothetical protein
MNRSATTDSAETRGRRELALHLDEFGWEALDEQSAAFGVSVEELLAFAAMYYLADLDSGRVARRIDARYRES